MLGLFSLFGKSEIYFFLGWILQFVANYGSTTRSWFSKWIWGLVLHRLWKYLVESLAVDCDVCTYSLFWKYVFLHARRADMIFRVNFSIQYVTRLHSCSIGLSPRNHGFWRLLVKLCYFLPESLSCKLNCSIVFPVPPFLSNSLVYLFISNQYLMAYRHCIICYIISEVFSDKVCYTTSLRIECSQTWQVHMVVPVCRKHESRVGLQSI
jgi:hypothetical protein